MKMSDNEAEQKKFAEEVLGYKDKIKRRAEEDKEEILKKVKNLEKKQKEINRETAKLWKSRRNRRDYLLHNMLTEKIADEIYVLSLMLNKYKREVYRTSSNSCFCINKPFKGSIGHHVDKNTIVFIPETLHLTVKHNLKTAKGMKEINENAFRWLRQKHNVQNRILKEKREKDVCE